MNLAQDKVISIGPRYYAITRQSLWNAKWSCKYIKVIHILRDLMKNVHNFSLEWPTILPYHFHINNFIIFPILFFVYEYASLLSYSIIKSQILRSFWMRTDFSNVTPSIFLPSVGNLWTAMLHLTLSGDSVDSSNFANNSLYVIAWLCPILTVLVCLHDVKWLIWNQCILNK